MENIIKIDLREVDCEDVNYTALALNRAQQRIIVNVDMNLQFLQTEVLISLIINKCSRKILYHFPVPFSCTIFLCLTEHHAMKAYWGVEV